MAAAFDSTFQLNAGQENGAWPNANSSSPKIKDPDFYFESKFVVFEVDGHLFRVPTHLLIKESDFFRDLFDLPQGERTSEGSSAANPIVMPANIKHEDFRNVLKILYPISIQRVVDLSKSEWISVLNLSTMWLMANLKNIAIVKLDELGSLTPEEKVTWGRKCSVPRWILAGYVAIVEQSQTIDDAEVDIVGEGAAIKLFRIRENIYRNRYYSHNLKGIITEAFKDEIDPQESST